MLPFLYLCAMPDSVLLHMRFILRKRNITVLRDSFSRYYGRHLRVSFNDGLYRRVRQGELRQRRKRRCPGVRPRRAVPLSRQMLFIRVHFPCAGEQCSPLRDNHVQMVNKRCAESSHPTVYLYYNIKTEKHGKTSHIQTNRFAYFQRVSS